MNPYSLIKKIRELTRESPKSVTGNNRTSLTVEVNSRDQTEKICELKDVEGFKSETTIHPHYNFSRGLV